MQFFGFFCQKLQFFDFFVKKMQFFDFFVKKIAFLAKKSKKNDEKLVICRVRVVSPE